MPRLPVDYSKTIIYVIKCKDDNIIEEYIGSTTNFNERKYSHKSRCNNDKDKSYNLKIYQYIRENGGWSNWIMIELEKFNCNDKREAEKREEEIKVERKAKLNMIKAFGAETRQEYKKQYSEEHKEQIKQYREEHKEQNKKWREEHKEEEKKRHKKYYEEHQEEHKEQMKKWREEHKEHTKEYYKKWREDNKEQLKEKKKIYQKKYREQKKKDYEANKNIDT